MENNLYMKYKNGKTIFSVCCKKCTNLLVTTHRKTIRIL